MTEETKDNDTVSIFDYLYFVYPKFDEWYKEKWFEETCDYDANGEFNGDAYAESRDVIKSYMQKWSEAHNAEEGTDEFEKELQLVRPVFMEKYKTKDITPEEAEALWEEYARTPAYYNDRAEESMLAWYEELENLSYGHFLPWRTYIIQGSETRWNGSRAGAAIWESDAATVGELIKDARACLLDGHDHICVEASRSTGGITVSGSHHDGGSTHTIYAVDERKLVDKEGNRIDLEEYLELYSMDEADAIGKITISLAAIVDNVYNGTPLDPVFAKK